MENKILSKDILDKDIIEVYDDIDILRAVEEHVLYKGIECLRKVSGIGACIEIQELIPTALYAYHLKYTSTNILNVDIILTKQAKRSGNFYFANGKFCYVVERDFYDELERKDYEFRHPNRQMDNTELSLHYIG